MMGDKQRINEHRSARRPNPRAFESVCAYKVVDRSQEVPGAPRLDRKALGLDETND